MNLDRENLDDPKCRKHFENEFQQFVHSVNHLSRNSNESPFTNVSVFDKVKLKFFVSEEVS
jgi:ribonucleoside-triphosphate reductase